MEKPTVTKYCEGSSNNTLVTIGDLNLYFSYDTIIAFRIGNDLVIRKNDFSKTTGKHLNAINPDKQIRMSGSEFEEQLNAVLESCKVTAFQEEIKNWNPLIFS